MHMTRKGQFASDRSQTLSFADQFMRWQDKSVRCTYVITGRD